MKVLEDQITIVMGGHEPTMVTGEAGGSSSSTRLDRATLAVRLLEQAQQKFDRKA